MYFSCHLKVAHDNNDNNHMIKPPTTGKPNNQSTDHLLLTQRPINQLSATCFKLEGQVMNRAYILKS